MKVALVHDWFTGMRGGEYVFEAIAELFPQAEVFTLIYLPGRVSPEITVLKKHVSWLQKIPQVESRYRYFLPLMPKAIEGFDLSGFDLIISSSHCVAKGIRKPKNAVHISYIHAPMRYMWDRFDDYFGKGRAAFPVRLAAKVMRSYLQAWDLKTSSPERVDYLICNSHFIADQVKKNYGRDSVVIHPFADQNRFKMPRIPGRNYLMVGAFAPNKRVDLAIEAFNKMKLPLLIVGSGQDEYKLKKMAGPTVELLGNLSNAAIADLLSKCKAFVFPGLEDFGITPIEAMAAGVPVIAYQAGGVLDTITEKTGVFFKTQTVDALIEAVTKFESGSITIHEADCRAQAAKFTKENFQKEFLKVISDLNHPH